MENSAPSMELHGRNYWNVMYCLRGVYAPVSQWLRVWISHRATLCHVAIVWSLYFELSRVSKLTTISSLAIYGKSRQAGEFHLSTRSILPELILGNINFQFHFNKNIGDSMNFTNLFRIHRFNERLLNIDTRIRC